MNICNECRSYTRTTKSTKRLIKDTDHTCNNPEILTKYCSPVTGVPEYVNCFKARHPEEDPERHCKQFVEIKNGNIQQEFNKRVNK